MFPTHALKGTRIIAIEDVDISPLSGVVNYGLGCFEGIRAYWNEAEQQLYIFRLLEHLQRLQNSAKVLHIHLPDDIEEFGDAIRDLLRAENCREDVYIRPLAYKHNLKFGGRLDRLDDAIMTWVVPIEDDPRLARGLKVSISDWQRINSSAVPTSAKLTGSYINPVLARTTAQINGYDDCILLNSQAQVAEGSGWNIFLIKDKTLITPAISEDILEGITRDTLLKVAKEELNLNIEERVVEPDELFNVDEVIACGTGLQILPVVEIDDTKIGDGQSGDSFRQLWRIYSDMVHNKIPKYGGWLSPVYQYATE